MNKSILKIAETIENAPKQRWNEPLQSFLEYQTAFANSHEEPEPEASKYQAEAEKHLAHFLTQVEKIENILPRNEHITKGFNLKNQKRLSQFLDYYDLANYYLTNKEYKLQDWLHSQNTPLFKKEQIKAALTALKAQSAGAMTMLLAKIKNKKQDRKVLQTAHAAMRKHTKECTAIMRYHRWFAKHKTIPELTLQELAPLYEDTPETNLN
jgi:hypothetical protein